MVSLKGHAVRAARTLNYTAAFRRRRMAAASTAPVASGQHLDQARCPGSACTLPRPKFQSQFRSLSQTGTSTLLQIAAWGRMASFYGRIPPDPPPDPPSETPEPKNEPGGIKPVAPPVAGFVVAVEAICSENNTPGWVCMPPIIA